MVACVKLLCSTYWHVLSFIDTSFDYWTLFEPNLATTSPLDLL